MLKYIGKRTIQMVITLLIVATLIFLMFRIMPGDPSAAMIDPSIPQEAREQMMERYGLNDGLWTQYTVFMADLLRFDFGQSFYYNRDTIEILGDKLASTLILMFAAMIFAYGIGVFGGAWMAWRRGTWGESFATVLALVFRSAPTFWLGIMAIYLFSVILGWFPHSGIRTSGYEADNWMQVYFTWDFVWHLILPTIVAGVFFLATPLLIMRNTMLEVMGEDYIEMAKAKGVKERKILFRHAARNALLPVVTAGALFIGSAIGGQVLVEYVFSWPGLGQEIVLAAQRHDYPLAQGSFIIMAALIMIMNLVADIVYAYLDPRISYK
ncbi:ABC transporter permease [Evansella halocellulosilytica]|uniref:ABC transporter permease n=1 Tax=Evansella halocellulosilytica TaxID=2011013 RepID=UPI000BB78F54|nr:ABC transporter permease [Evansella halocellulosilytica]